MSRYETTDRLKTSPRPDRPVKRLVSRSVSTIRLAVVDGHPPIRLALGTLFGQTEGYEVVGDGASAEEVYQLLEAGNVDILILSFNLGDSHLLEVIKNLHSWYPKVKVVVYTSRSEQLYAARALRAGASGYVEKGRPLEDLIEAVNTVHAGDLYVSSEIYNSVLNHCCSSNPTVDRVDSINRLTDRELEIFELIGRGHSTREIEEILHLSRKTLEMHRRAIKDKLGFETTNDLLFFASHIAELQM